MKLLATGLVLAIAMPALAQTTPAEKPITVTGAAPVTGGVNNPLEGGSNFIDPMGQPFRSKDQLSGAEHWFQATDTNHDGRITPDELRADADRFFAILDTDHDGEIGPDELTRYETDIAPEIRVASSMGDMSQIKTDDDGNVTMPPYPARLGAGRFGYLDMPEPVISADANMDRAVSLREFEASAARRFKMLDTNGDGAITRDELPKLSARAAEVKKGRRGKMRRETQSIMPQ